VPLCLCLPQDAKSKNTRPTAAIPPTLTAAILLVIAVKPVLRLGLALVALLAILQISACSRGRRVLETAYVSAPQAILRDQVAAVYKKTGSLKNGEAVQVLERERRFARVRTASGDEGWVEQRALVSQQVYDRCQKLAQQEQNSPVQAAGTTRNQTNIHLEPNREAEHLYQLDQGSKVSLLRRASSEKKVPGAPAKRAVPEKTDKKGQPQPTIRALEDWWLVRDAQGRVGWILARMVDIDAPLEIAQYAEGQRIVAFFVLNQVPDGEKKVAQYLVLLTEPKDGLPFDYNQIRVFTWNARRHRYETAYRERNLDGVLPVTVSQETFEKEGSLPVFVLHVKDDAGNVSERKYKLNTPMVRRVLAPGEQPLPKPSARRGRRR
jgi:SH3-like domain-containing protein